MFGSLFKKKIGGEKINWSSPFIQLILNDFGLLGAAEYIIMDWIYRHNKVEESKGVPEEMGFPAFHCSLMK